jgi:hypothetical protein
MRRILAISALVGAAIGLHGADLGLRGSALHTFVRSSGEDVAAVERYDPGAGRVCPARPGGDREALTRALITVESFATPRVETWWKDFLARALAWAGLSLPDLTYGPGRVRLSTAERALSTGSLPSTDSELGVRLLDYCQTQDIVSALVSEILRSQGSGERSSLDLPAVRRVASAYNGQAAPTTPEAVVAHETYNALVFALFEQYRFDSLRGRRILDTGPSRPARAGLRPVAGPER